MRSDAIIAGMVGGVVGLLTTGFAAWMTKAVYDDREFDVMYTMPLYTAALLVSSALLLWGALAARTSGEPPVPRTFMAATVAGIVAFAAGSAFGFIGISSSGPPTFFLVAVLLPCSIIISASAFATWFARRDGP